MCVFILSVCVCVCVCVSCFTSCFAARQNQPIPPTNVPRYRPQHSHLSDANSINPQSFIKRRFKRSRDATGPTGGTWLTGRELSYNQKVIQCTGREKLPKQRKTLLIIAHLRIEWTPVGFYSVGVSAKSPPLRLSRVRWWNATPAPGCSTFYLFACYLDGPHCFHLLRKSEPMFEFHSTDV